MHGSIGKVSTHERLIAKFGYIHTHSPFINLLCSLLLFSLFLSFFGTHNESPAFAAAIDWNERWIQMLIGFEVMLFIVVLVFRNSYEFQSVLFLVICLLVAFSERINTLCAEHWRLFATQNYFDVHGTFAITLFSGPLLFIGLVQVVCLHVQIYHVMCFDLHYSSDVLSSLHS